MRRNHILIARYGSSSHGTFGRLLIDGHFFCYTAEPSWNNNEKSVSCIPRLSYFVNWLPSLRYDYAYEVSHVPNRSLIKFHRGNYCGDIDTGLRSDTEGCILLGKYRGILGRQRAILVSAPTVIAFEDILNRESFDLTITGGY